MSETTIPSMQEFCVARPLYAGVLVHGLEYQFFRFITEPVNIDFFCVECQQPSVFVGPELNLRIPEDHFDMRDRIFTREFYCSRVSSHTAHFHFEMKKDVLSKIGQSPSMADISEAGLRPYSKVLSNDEYREMAKAVGLASHGVGIGSFVYLRRIFERLINEARAIASSDAGWDESAFQQARMEEKIELLKLHLPTFLVEQRKLYSILSKGIHSLSEQECLEAFPIVRVGIELILDQKVAAKQQAAKMDEAKKRISALQQKLQSTPTTSE